MNGNSLPSQLSQNCPLLANQASVIPSLTAGGIKKPILKTQSQSSQKKIMFEAYVQSYLKILSVQPEQQPKPQNVKQSCYQYSGEEIMLEPVAEDDCFEMLEVRQLEHSDILEVIGAREGNQVYRPETGLD